jgi:predicted TIM-barrel fold metal-dependent hydrolase
VAARLRRPGRAGQCEADWARWTDAGLAPYLAEAAARFGPGRLLFGSDWPVCTLAASYGQVLAAVRRSFPAPDLEKIFWLNASAVYRLDLGALVAAGPARSARGGSDD